MYSLSDVSMSASLCLLEQSVGTVHLACQGRWSAVPLVHVLVACQTHAGMVGAKGLALPLPEAVLCHVYLVAYSGAIF